MPNTTAGAPRRSVSLDVYAVTPSLQTGYVHSRYGVPLTGVMQDTNNATKFSQRAPSPKTATTLAPEPKRPTRTP